jgi:hypothetical protein
MFFNMYLCIVLCYRRASLHLTTKSCQSLIVLLTSDLCAMSTVSENVVHMAKSFITNYITSHPASSSSISGTSSGSSGYGVGKESTGEYKSKLYNQLCLLLFKCYSLKSYWKNESNTSQQQHQYVASSDHSMYASNTEV